MQYDVEHFLRIYSIRKGMQEDGVINPSERIKKFTLDLVEKLESLSLKETIVLKDNAFYDSRGNLIIKLPVD